MILNFIKNYIPPFQYSNILVVYSTVYTLPNKFDKRKEYYVIVKLYICMPGIYLIFEGKNSQRTIYALHHQWSA